MNRYLHTIPCACGRVHEADINDILIGEGVIRQLPECVASLGGKKPFLLADPNTWKAAGEQCASLLSEAGIRFASYCFRDPHPIPNEGFTGNAVMHFDPSCDLIVGIGSGVINDICKVLSLISRRPFIIVATAPSMDGYASATSAMELDSLKVSLPTRCADIIIGDTNILKDAPRHMLSSGIGDIIAKYSSIAEWRISHLITGEYYCEQVAQLVRDALRKCSDHADGLLQRDPKAVEAVFEGLIISGLAMAYAGVSRPASGTEHYFSHIWDMRSLAFGTPSDLHGIQCGAATLTTVRLYSALSSLKPDEEKAAAYVRSFDYDQWKETLKDFLGESAQTMIDLEKKEGKYNKETHAARFARIRECWPQILQILSEELPAEGDLYALLKKLDIPTDLKELGVSTECARTTFKATKDIRDKYILARLAWDLGVLDELSEVL